MTEVNNELDYEEDHTIDATFVEDGHVVKIGVSPGELNELDSLGSKDEDNEVTVGRPHSQEASFIDEENESHNANRSRSRSPEGSGVEDGQIDYDEYQSQECVNKTRSPGKSTKSQYNRNNKRKMDEEDKQEVINETLARVQVMFDRSGIMEMAKLIKQHFGDKGGKNFMDNENSNQSNASRSEVTIYKNVVPNLIPKNLGVDARRQSSSSEEEGINISDEMIDCEADSQNLMHEFIVEQRQRNRRESGGHCNEDEEPRPSTSRAPTQGKDEREQQASTEYEDRADRMIQEAENVKAKIYQTAGESLSRFMIDSDKNAKQGFNVNNSFIHSAMVDQDYLVLAGHIDPSLQEKIAKGEYVELAKLLPRDKLATEEEQKLQVVIKNGQTFWVPVQDRNNIKLFQMRASIQGLFRYFFKS